MNEGKIINYLQQDKQEKAFRRLYQYFPKVEKHILINSGSKEEALDIFQDALIILYQKVQTLDANSPIKIDGFLVNTCKLLWSNELRKKKVRTGNDEGLASLEFTDEIQEQLEKEEKYQAVESIIKQLGNKCKSILMMFYYKKVSMDTIAKEFGYKSVKSAKAQKYKCMENARKLALEMSNPSQSEFGSKNELS